MSDWHTDWDQHVLGAIEAGGAAGVWVPDILESVDAAEKAIIPLFDLNETLRRLVATDRVVPHRDGRFTAAGANALVTASFRPVSAEVYEAAIEEYRRRFALALGEIAAGRVRVTLPPAD